MTFSLSDLETDPVVYAVMNRGSRMTVIVIVATMLLARFVRRWWPTARQRSPRFARGWWLRLGLRVTVLVILSGLLVSLSQFNRVGNPWRAAYDAAGATWVAFHQPGNYASNGFVAGTLYNMPNTAMERPPGYSEATMRELASRYADAAALRNPNASPDALADVNVVMVLAESFADPAALQGVGLERDPFPLTRKRMAEAWGGQTLANMYGTGTSTMEFQALTGQSLALLTPQIWSPYQDYLTGHDEYPSAVEWFNRFGHATVAIHPYLATMYQRNRVYPLFGFDRFLHAATMRHTEPAGKGSFISDVSAFAEVLDQLEAHDEPVFTHLVTMQNHVPTAGVHTDPMEVTGVTDRSAVRAIGGAARGMELTDQALDAFLTKLESSPEPTIVLLYGDHYPGMYPPEILAQNLSLTRRRTPLLVWSNTEPTPRDLGTVSSASFMPSIFEMAGQTMPPYYELLLQVQEEVGAFTRDLLVSPDGVPYERADLTARQQQLLADYALVQYDFSIGERYVVEEMFYETPPA